MKNTKGFCLLEALVCLSLLAFALMIMDKVEFDVLQRTQANYYFMQAMNQISNLSDRLRMEEVNQEAIIDQWNKENSEVLPWGEGRVIGRYPVYSITLRWGSKQVRCEETTIGVSGCIKEDVRRVA